MECVICRESGKEICTQGVCRDCHLDSSFDDCLRFSGVGIPTEIMRLPIN